MSVTTIGWYLENRQPGHHKFYTVLITDNGVVVTAWGRIGAEGQAKIQKLNDRSDAEAIGMRQVYAKRAKGYEFVNHWSSPTDSVKFTLEDQAIQQACQNDNARRLLWCFHEALRDPKFEGDKKSVIGHYDDFVTKAQRLMDEAATRPFEQVYGDFEELEAAWREIHDKHGEAETTLGLTRQMLQAALLNGGAK